MKVLLVQDQNSPSMDVNKQCEAYYDNSYYVDSQTYASANEMGYDYDQADINMVNYSDHSYEEQL